MDRAERIELQGLMSRLAEGDRTAFHPVFERLSPLVRGFVSKQLGPFDAEDVSQQVLLKVFERAGEFDSRLDALSWVLGVSAYEARTMKRRMWRRREDFGCGVAINAIPDGGPSPEDAAANLQLQEAATSLLGALRPHHVETLLAMARGERPACAGATFRKRLERALGRLREAWRTKYGS